jgi:hypothetical protein
VGKKGFGLVVVGVRLKWDARPCALAYPQKALSRLAEEALEPLRRNTETRENVPRIFRSKMTHENFGEDIAKIRGQSQIAALE